MLFKMSTLLRLKNVFRMRIPKSIFTVAKPARIDEVVKRSKDIDEQAPFATMNDLPVPCESWAKYDKKRQQKYNRILFAGIICMVMSMAVFENNDKVKLYWRMQYRDDYINDMD